MVIEHERRTVLTKNQKQDIRRFLKTGDSDLWASNWPGGPVLGGAQASLEMRRALVAEVASRTKDLRAPEIPSIDLQPFVRGKVEPMVRGLFLQHEQDPVLSMLEKSVVFLTPDTIEGVLLKTSRLSLVWKLANLYLSSLNADLLSKDAEHVLGMSEETTCYVSLEYFGHKDRFADFVVHEAAHVFHNCKRPTVGLPETRTREWLLNINFNQRETFAYACEAYSRIIQLGSNAKEQLQLVDELESSSSPPDDRVDIEKYHGALRAAAAARNGWKKILEACSPSKVHSKV